MNIEEKFERRKMIENELTRLLKQPFRARQGTFRQGDFVGLTVTPRQSQEQALVDLTVYVFPLRSPRSDADEQARASIAFKVFRSELEDSDYHIRMAACQALGQSGNRRARSLLEAKAQDDENDYVRATARKALTILESRDFSKEELAKLPLVISQEVNGYWQELAAQATDAQGIARFHTVPAAAACRLALQPSEFPGAVLHALNLYLPAMYSEAGFADTGETTLAAQKHSEADLEGTLPQSREIELEDGSLVFVLYQNEQGEVILTFRSLAPSLREQRFSFVAKNRQTNVEELKCEVQLKLEDDQAADEDSVPTASFNLSARLDMKQAYEIEVKLSEPQ